MGGWDKGKERKESEEEVGDGGASEEVEQVIESMSQSEFGENDMEQDDAKGRPTWVNEDAEETAEEWIIHCRMHYDDTTR